MRTIVGAGLVVLALVGAPLPARADVVFGATVMVNGTTLSYAARAGFRNMVSVRRDGVDWLVSELGGLGIVAGAGCAAAGTSSVRCPASGTSRVSVNLGDWDDTLTLGTGVSTEVYGGDGNDTINGGSGPDYIDAGLGADVVNGGAGEDVASYQTRTRSVRVTLDGGSGDDGEPGEWDTVGADVEDAWGGSAGDYLYGNDNRNILYGLGGYDHLYGLGGSDLLYGGDDNDTIDGGTGADFVYGENGNDTADYGARTAAVTVWLDGSRTNGESGEGDLVSVNTENVTGGRGDDLLVGNDVRNVLLGGPGADALIGNGGDDALLGEDGDDLIFGGDGDDWMPGDRYGGPPGRDRIEGGDGVDSASYEGRTVTVLVLLDGTANDGQYGEGDNILSTETVYGGRGDDAMVGSGAAETFYGGDGRDYLDGGAGPDVLRGESGDDTLYGAAGDDALYGGTGVDDLDAEDGTDRCEVPDGGLRRNCETWL